MANLIVSETWHKSPTMNVQIYYSANRPSATDNYIDWYFEAHMQILYGSYYGYPLSVVISVDGVNQEIWLKDSSPASGFDVGGSVSFRTTNTNTGGAQQISIHPVCHQTGGCSKGYGNVYYYPTVYFTAYSPWQEPTLASNVRTNKSRIKPDEDITVLWNSAISRSGNGIGKYSVNCARYRNGSWTSRITLNDNVGAGSTSLVVRPGNSINLRPGDKVRFDVDTWVNSYVSGHASGWYGYRTAADVSIYKDGIILYKDSTGAKRECVLGYMKDSTGAKRKYRYILIKDSTGAKRIIDVYTINYE